ncbi:MAG: hypothetical protein IPK59_10440 [Rhodospirillaceae bacterium]|nr:hypothetical protein [Rhodospirillaceae bacterium]
MARIYAGGAGRITHRPTPADIATLDNKLPRAQQMAQAMVGIRRVFGVCYDRDLITIGFTRAELDMMGTAAIEHAAVLAPDLIANDDERQHLGDEDVAAALDVPALLQQKANAVRPVAHDRGTHGRNMGA